MIPATAHEGRAAAPPQIENELRILVIAPTSNDARLTARFLQRASLIASICDSARLSTSLREGCGALLLAEEAMTAELLHAIVGELHAQPSWADLPIIIITGFGETARIRSRYLAALGPVGNISVIERPVRPETLVSSCEVALRSRRRQYEVRDLIREREEMIRQAHRQARIFDTTLSSIPDFTYIFDRSSRFIYANKSLLDLWGLELDEIVGKTFAELPYPPDLADKLHRQIQQVFKTNTVLRDETAYTNPTGSTGYYEYILSPVLGPNGEVEVVAGSTRDTSERRRTEERLREADRRKDEFLAMLAHELRNPLAAVASAAQVLRAPEGDATDWATGVIERQTGHLVHLIDDLLDVSRITTGKIRLRKEILDAGVVLARARDSALPALAERKHNLTSRFETGLLWIEADPTRLEQIVVNLLTNAAKYTPVGGRVELTAEIVKDEVQITVRDNGMGIAPDRLPEMFELFAQGERSIARSEGGLGIGLTIVRRLTEMHGGRVEAYSEGPNRGSTFTVYLPRSASALASPDATAGSMDKEGAGLRVLIVDDNEDIAQGLGRLLRRAGHQTHLAHSGSEAVVFARQFEPDAVVLDIGLPDMDGYEVARLLREEPCCQGALLIAVTGYGQRDDKQRALRSGFDFHLVKPIDLKELKALLVRESHVDP